MAEHYDVIIIGTGAGGGTLAHTLAPSGKRILLIGRGGFLSREKENWEPEAVFVQGRYTSTDSWEDEEGKAFQPRGPLLRRGRDQALWRRPLPLAPR